MLPFIDLAAQQARIRPALDAAIARVLAHGGYVMGPEVRAFEAALAAFGQADLALSCANGTDALALPLMAWEIGAGDAVFCPSFTFAATCEVIPWFGATPVFVDILPDTYCLDPASLEAAIAAVAAEGRLKPAAVIAVDLFGQPADYPALAEICRRHGVKLIADFGAGLRLHPSRQAPDPLGRRRRPPASFPPSRWAATATAARCWSTTRRCGTGWIPCASMARRSPGTRPSRATTPNTSTPGSA